MNYYSLRKPLFLLLCLSSALAAPVFNPNALLPRHESRIIARQDQVTQPVSFQTVTTTDTQVGSITQTCDVTLTPITGEDGAALIREDKSCTFTVVPLGGSAPPPDNNNPGNSNDRVIGDPNNNDDTGSGNNAPPPDQITTTDSGGQTTISSADPNATSTAGGDQSAPPDTATFETSVVGTATDVPGAAQSSGATTSADASATASAPPPAISGTEQIPADSTAAPSGSGGTDTAATATTATPSLSTQSDGAVVTISPTAAQAQESAQQQEVPGRKLEVLPIGLGVFAGISVIALIVVGLVTYERTKYRKAFRQRKLAEAGANMGYGGMAERT